MNLHFNSRVLLKSQHRFSPKLSCWTEALTGDDGERQVSGSHTVQGDGKPKSHAIWRMCCLATAPTPPALGARMGGLVGCEWCDLHHSRKGTSTLPVE